MKTEQREEGTPTFSTAPTIVATMAWFSTYLGVHIGMQVPVATWMSVMSRSGTNTAIVIWCIAAAVYARNNFKRKESLT